MSAANIDGGGAGREPVPEVGARVRAEAWLMRGQRCEASGSMEGRREAVRCQDEALAAVAELACMSKGCGEEVGLVARIWMNRGNALLGLGRAEPAREAVRSYDQALALLEADAAAGERARLGGAERGMMAGAAWLNRAAAVQAAHADSGAGEAGLGRAEAGACLERAIARLTPLAEAHGPARRNLAGAWMNLAEWAQGGGDEVAALRAWRRVVGVAAGGAGRDATMLELTLRARHAICVDLGRGLAGGEGRADVDEATEKETGVEAQVEAGLAEFSAWRGTAPGVRATAARLFEFGAWFFRTRRPGRLAGFLAEHADPGDVLRVEIARAAIHLARQEILRTDFSDLLGETGEARRSLLRGLGLVEARLAAGVAKSGREGG